MAPTLLCVRAGGAALETEKPGWMDSSRADGKLAASSRSIPYPLQTIRNYPVDIPAL